MCVYAYTCVLGIMGTARKQSKGAECGPDLGPPCKAVILTPCFIWLLYCRHVGEILTPSLDDKLLEGREHFLPLSRLLWQIWGREVIGKEDNWEGKNYIFTFLE